MHSMLKETLHKQEFLTFILEAIVYLFTICKEKIDNCHALQNIYIYIYLTRWMKTDAYILEEDVCFM